MIKIRDLRLRTKYITVDNGNEPEFLEFSDSAPECGPGASPVVSLWRDVSPVGDKGVGRDLLKVVGYVVCLGVNAAIIDLEPDQPHSRLGLRVAEADGRLEATFHLAVFLCKQ